MGQDKQPALDPLNKSGIISVSPSFNEETLPTSVAVPFRTKRWLHSKVKMRDRETLGIVLYCFGAHCHFTIY